MKTSLLRLRGACFRSLPLLTIVATSMAANCTNNDAATTLVATVDPRSRVDTTYVGQTISIATPTLRTSSDTIVEQVPLHWASSNSSVVSFSFAPDQLSTYFPAVKPFTASGVGTAVVTMTPDQTHFLNGITQAYTHTIVVLPGTASLFDVSDLVLRTGDVPTLDPQIRTSAGGPLVTVGSIHWVVADPSVVKLGFTSTGLQSTFDQPSIRAFVEVHPIALGNTTLTGTWTSTTGATLTKTITVYVIPTGARVDFIRTDRSFIFRAGTTTSILAGSVLAQAVGTNGAFVSGTLVQFLSRDPALVSIEKLSSNCPFDPANQCAGYLHIDPAVALTRSFPAKTWILAGLNGSYTDSVEVTIYPAIASIVATPATAIVILGGTTSISVIPRDANGRTIPVEAAFLPLSFAFLGIHLIEHSSGQIDVLEGRDIAASGTEGFTITFGFPNSSVASNPVTVTLRAIDHVVVTPADATFSVGATATYTAKGVDAAGRDVTLSLPVTWSSGNTAIATVISGSAPTTMVTSVAVGATSIGASITGILGTTPITVHAAPPGPPASITITPTTATRSPSATQVYIVTLLDGQGQNTSPDADGVVHVLTDDSNVGQVQSTTFDGTLLQTSASVTVRSFATAGQQTNVRAFYTRGIPTLFSTTAIIMVGP